MESYEKREDSESVSQLAARQLEEQCRVGSDKRR